MLSSKRKILLFLIIAALWLGGSSSCVYFNTYYNAKYYFAEGEKENENNDTGRPKTANYQKSINSAARILEYYPESKYVDDALLLMGKAYYAIRSYPKAKRKCEELIANYPESPLVYEARLYLGKTLIAMRRIDEGIAILNRLWTEDQVPLDVKLESQSSLADYYFDKESYRQALLEYQKILERQKDKVRRAEIQYKIGECYYALEEYRDAEQAFLKVLDEKPTRMRRFDAQYKRALCLQHLGELEKALKICDKLLKKDIYYDYYDKAYLAKAGILSDLGRYEEAIELYKRILELYPRTETSAEAAYRLGWIYWDQYQDFTKAEEYLGKVRTEKSTSEFVEEAMARVNDIRFLENLDFSLDSLKTDIDTLKYHLEWLAETPPEMRDSLLAAARQTAPDTSSATPAPAVSGPALTPEQVPLPGGDKGGPAPPGGPYQPGYPGGRPGTPPTGTPPTTERVLRLAPFPRDSAAVYERIADDEEMLAQTRFRLAELLWSRFDNLDSAQVIYCELAQDSLHPDVQARSLLALYHLAASASPDSTGPDSLLERIHRDFPGTEYDRWVRPLLGLEPLPEPVDSVAEAFRAAEDLWMTGNDPQAAILKYREIAERWPESDYAPKALFAVAWIQEHLLEDIPGALASYDSLIAWYPQSQYVNIARNKTAPPPPEIPDSTLALGDTTAAAGEATVLGPAPPGSGPPELIGGEDALAIYIAQHNLYPFVAAEAEIPGEVLVAFTVDSEGVPKDFRILREEPEGFDFGQNAIQALQGMKFRPAYRDGQYIEAPATQIVRFEP